MVTVEVVFSCWVMSDPLQPCRLCHTRLLCPPLSPAVCSNSGPAVKSVTLSSHLILHHPLLQLLSIFPSIRVFSNELTLCITWPTYWSFISVLPMNIQGWFSFGLTGLISLQSRGLSRVFSSTTIGKHQFCRSGLLEVIETWIEVVANIKWEVFSPMSPYRKWSESLSLYQNVKSRNRPYWPYHSPTYADVGIAEVLIQVKLSFFPTRCPMEVFCPDD